MKLNRTIVIVSACVLSILCITASLAEEGRPSRRELYKYLWDFVLIGDGEATTEDLQNIASYYSSVKAEDKTKIEETLASPGISDREKRQNLTEILPNLRYGTLVTKDGQTHSGIIRMRIRWHNGDFHDEPVMDMKLTKGGDTTIVWSDIVEINFNEEVTVRTNNNKLLKGSVTDYFAIVYASDVEPVEIHKSQIKTIVFGRLNKVQCQECFRKMEIDWNYCPYCGVKLKRQ